MHSRRPAFRVVLLVALVALAYPVRSATHRRVQSLDGGSRRLLHVSPARPAGPAVRVPGFVIRHLREDARESYGAQLGRARCSSRCCQQVNALIEELGR